MKKVFVLLCSVFVLMSCKEKPYESIEHLTYRQDFYRSKNVNGIIEPVYVYYGSNLLKEALSIAGKPVPDSYYRENALKYYNTDVEAELGAIDALPEDGYECIEATTNFQGEVMFSACCFFSTSYNLIFEWAEGCMGYLEEQGFVSMSDDDVLGWGTHYVKDGLYVDVKMPAAQTMSQITNPNYVYSAMIVFFLEEFLSTYLFVR